MVRKTALMGPAEEQQERLMIQAAQQDPTGLRNSMNLISNAFMPL